MGLQHQPSAALHYGTDSATMKDPAWYGSLIVSLKMSCMTGWNSEPFSCQKDYWGLVERTLGLKGPRSLGKGVVIIYGNQGAVESGGRADI